MTLTELILKLNKVYVEYGDMKIAAFDDFGYHSDELLVEVGADRNGRKLYIEGVEQ